MTSLTTLDNINGSYPRAAARTVTLDRAKPHGGVPPCPTRRGNRMSCLRQQRQPHQGLSPARFTAALALALLIVIGGAAVTVWNTLDLMTVLVQ